MGNPNKNKNNKSIDEDKSGNGNQNNKSIDEDKYVKRRKARRIKKDKYKKVKSENFSLVSQKNGQKFEIENINDFNQYGEIKKYKKTFLVTETIIYDLNIIKNNVYSNLENYFKINDFNIISDKNQYIKNKIQSYAIEYFNNEQFIPDHKIKYKDSEIIISSNEINIYIEKNKKRIKKEINLENGIPINELKIERKRKLENISNIDKVKKIIEKIENENILKKILKGKNKNINYFFCVNCNESFEKNNTNDNNNNSHINDEHFILDINYFKDIEYELDYDEKLNKIYNILKKEQKKILKNANNKLINYYRQLLFSLYEIITNDNSFEELYSSIININENYFKEKELGTFSENLKDLFLLFSQIISQLTFFKAQEISLNELDEENDSKFDEARDDNLLSEIDFDKFNEEEKKKYFFELGFNFKNKINTNISISELYSKAKEENILINDYEHFFNKELNIQN